MKLKQFIFAFTAMLLCFSVSVNAQVAKVGGTEYTTLADALDAAKAKTGNVTVELYEKVTLNQPLNGSFTTITFVGKDTDAEIYLDVQGYITATNKKVAFENLTLSKSQGGFIANAGFMNVAFGVYDVAEVTYTNCTFANGAYASSGKVTYDGCTFKKSWDKYGLWAYGNVDVTVQGSTFADYRGIKMYAENGADASVEKANLTVKNTNFSAVDNKPAIVLTYGESVVLEGNTYSSTGTFELDLDGKPNGVAVTSDVAPTCVNDNGACGVLVDGKIYTTVAQAAEVATAGSTVTLLHNSTETVKFPEGVTLNKNGFTANGVTVVAVAKIGDVEYATLQAALDAAAAGTGNVTVTILADVDLTGVDWNPVTVSAPGYPVVTVEGNGKTITDLNDMLFAGTWAGKSGLIIKNLTIAKSAIVNDKDDAAGNVGVGAFIGYPQASAIITLENCHLKNSSVEGGHWTGGLIGMAGGYNGADGPVFMNLTIKGCSVTGSTITGKGSVGGVIGHGSCAAWTNVVIEETTVSSNSITSTGSSNVKAGAVMGTIGAAGQPTTVNGVTHTGGMSVSATVATNTVKSNGTEITTIYGRQGTETGMLYVAGGSYDNYPIEEGVAYAAPAKGYKIEQNTNGTYGVVVDPAYGKVAKIGNEYYANFEEAFAAVQAGETLTLLTDLNLSDILTINKSITLDGNGKTLTYTGNGTSARAIDVPANADAKVNVTIENLTVDCTASYCQRGINYNEDGKLTLEGVTVKGTNVTYALNLPGSSDNCEVAINNSSLTGNIALNVWGENSTINATNTTFTAVDNSTVEGYAAVKLNNDGTTSAEGTVINITGGKIDVTGSAAEDTEAVSNGTSTGAINISESTVVNGKIATLVAVIRYADGNSYSFETIEDAIEFAKEGETITLIRDVTVANKIVINKAITLDGNDKSLTYTGTDRAIDVPANADAKVNVTIENLTVDCTASYCQRGINYNEDGKLTLEGVTVKGTKVTYALNLPGSSDNCEVAINNSSLTGNIALNVWGENSTINAKNTTFTAVDNNTVEGYAAVKLNNDGTTSAEGSVINIIGGKIDVTGSACTDTEATSNGTSTGKINISESTVVNGKNAELVAVIRYADGNSYSFMTIEDAIEFAKAGETVTLIRDITASGIITINKAITLNGNGKTLTSSAERAINVSGAEANGVKIQNLTINASGERAINVIQNATNVTVDNVTATAKNYTVNVAASAPNAVVAIKNSNLTGLNVVNVAAPQANVTINGGTITCNDQNEDESYAALALNKDGKNATIAATGVTFDIKGDSKKAKNGAEGGVITIDGNTDDVDVVVAYIDNGGNYYYGYSSLKAAIAKAKEGETITLLRDVTMDYNARDAYETQAQNVVINGNGKTLTLNQKNSDWASIGLANNSKLVLNNMTIEKTGYGDTSGAWNTHAIIFTCPVEMNNVTVNNSIAVQAGATLNNVDIVEANGYYGLWINGNGQSVTMNGGSITATNGGRGIKIADQYIDAPEQVTLNVSGTEFNTAKKAAVLVSSKAGASITASDVDITNVAEDKVNFVWVDEDWAEYFSEVEVTGATVSIEGADSFAAAITENGAVKGYYKTLAEAIAAAEAGETVTMLTDVTLDDALIVEEGMDVTINGKGKTITGCDGKDVFYVKGGKLTLTEGLNVHATTDCAIYLRGGDVFTAANLTKSGDKYSVIQGNGNYAGNVTITGGKVEASGEQTAIYWPQNGKLTITGGEITGHSAVYIASGSLEITGGKLHGVGANGSYEGVTGGSANAPGEALTIENVGGNSGYEEISSVVITGGTFISDNAKAVGSYANTTQNPEAKPVAGFISGGTFSSALEASYCAEGYGPYAFENGTFGVESLNVDDITIVDGELTEFVNQNEKTVGTLTYKRSNIKNTWTPFYVPFAVPVSALADKFDVAYINDVRRTDSDDDGELDKFSMEIIYIHGGNANGSSKTLKANYPYFIRSKSGVAEMEITLTDATLYAAKENVYDCTTMTEKFEIKGNYHQIPSDKFGENDYVVGGGVWGNITAGYPLNPFRFYMTKSSRYEDEPAAPMQSMRIIVCGEEDENGATIIYDVVEDSLNNNGNDFIYDLQGRRVSEPKKGGIYIKNGKKILF